MLSRRFFEHDFWQRQREFDCAMAWLDCIRMAAFRPHRRLVNMTMVEIPRGAIIASERFLAQRWGWSQKKVQSFLSLLEREEMIVRKKNHHGGMITLCNFETYNNPGIIKESPKTRKRITEESPRNQIEEGKEGKEEHTGSPEPQAAAEPAVLVFPVVGRPDQPTWGLTQEQVTEFKKAFPASDILAQCRQALCWVQANPSRTKTPRGMKAFLFGWLSRSVNRGNAPAVSVPGRQRAPGGGWVKTVEEVKAQKAAEAKQIAEENAKWAAEQKEPHAA